MLKNLIEECKKAIRQYEELAKQYDEAARELEELGRQKAEEEQRLEAAREQAANAVDQWITDVFEIERRSEEWNPREEVLKEAEQMIRQYQSVADAGAVQEIFRADYERQRQKLTDEKSDREHELKIRREALEQAEKELVLVQNREELEPERDENAEQTRTALQKAGITAVPFYKTVEFSGELSGADCAEIEAQLQKMGILDALVVSPDDFCRVREECPEFLDCVLYVEKEGTSGFSGLVLSEELDDRLKETVTRILSNIYEEGAGQGVALGKDGRFRQGILAGKVHKAGEAEFVGLLARKKRKEQKIQELKGKICELSVAVSCVEQEITQIQKRLEKLQTEYQKLPGFAEINAALDKEKDCNLKLLRINEEYKNKEAQEQRLAEQKNQKYQTMLKKCKAFPYGRTEETYEEVVSVKSLALTKR